MEKTKKILLTALMMVIMAAVMVPAFFATPAEAAMKGYGVWTEKKSLPTSGSWYLYYDVSLERLRLTGDLNLDLNGKTVNFNSTPSASAIDVINGNFTLDDSVGGGKITMTKSKTSPTYQYDRAVYVQGKTFQMNGGTIEGFTTRGVKQTAPLLKS